MKKRLKKMNFAALVLLAPIFFASCDRDETADDPIQEQQTFEVAELQASDESEQISEEILSIGEDVYATDEISVSSKGYASDFLPDCVTITTVVTDSTKEKTIDFGEGCELPNGNILSGIIYLSYLKDMEMASKSLSLSLENFTFNGVAVEGSASIERVRSNENGNPQSDAMADFSGTWPDGTTASFNGNRTREWIEGFGSGFWGDNVFLITGKATYVGQQGNTHVREVITPLRREMACRFIVSGVLEISRNDLTASLDFGDGTCDAKGELTYPDGSTEEIFLRRFLK
ncbi:hypothetical protein [Poritiphilus flavus]|uniref:Lipoprotein n=1 Tax=Poritiphilus flavus TaxID=2697053 RepID=A0A6L9EIP6_9FLAO|nr:hypothetical protein [Poritiphilus flavus]NAS14059.1 hypothetical protein [Poritiphilus flavus]